MDVVLVDEQGQPIGVAPKNMVHTAETPLHLAFSCHVLNGDGEVLMTRRALSKKNLARGMDQFFLRSPHVRRKYHRRTNTPRTGGTRCHAREGKHRITRFQISCRRCQRCS